MHILLATDADWIVEEITGALGGEGDSFAVCRDGRAVAPQVKERTPDLAILDLQIGTMGGIAVTMDLRLDESAGALPHVPVLVLLDRQADLHLARRSGAEGWIVKPLDSLRLRKAANALLDGGTYHEGLPPSPTPAGDTDDGAAGEAGDEGAAPAEEEAPTPG